jgi:aspartyl-tRNA(Asn)/glutamyl-tRNA(Gln) amidotransferase subunit A
VITIASEMAAAIDSDPHFRRNSQLGSDVRINLALARHFKGSDYVRAQRIRHQAIATFQKIFEQVDAVVSPTTGCPAPAIQDDVSACGESDLTTLTEIMRYAPAANLTGLPAISVPAGYSPHGLPIGLQFMGPAWSEALLLHLAGATEQLVPRHAPPSPFAAPVLG